MNLASTAVQAPAPAPAPAGVGGAAPAPAGATAAPVPPAAQLVTVLNPLRAADGTHQISLRLQPEGLGMVDATVTVRAGHVVVELAADSLSGHQTLTAALPDLRQQLTQGGQQATVLMSGGGPDGRGHQSGSGFGAPGSGSAAEPDSTDTFTAPSPAPAGPGVASSVDIRL